MTVDISTVWYHMLNQGAPLITKNEDFVTFAKRFSYLRSNHSFNKFLRNLQEPGHTFNEIVLMKWLPQAWALFQVKAANQANAKAPALDICILYRNSTLIHKMFEIEMVGLAILLLEHKSCPPKQEDHSVSSSTGTTAVDRTPSILCDACRRRKYRWCVIYEGQRDCATCQIHSRVCSFVNGSQPRLDSLNGNGKDALEMVNRNGNEEIMRDALCHLFKSLESFLSTAFSKSCCRRKCLVPEDWLQMFAGLCSCSILKSLLIDAQAGTNTSDDGAQASIAARIDSAYKALISIFSWAAKSDLLVEWYRPAEMDESLRERSESEKESFETDFETLCQLVQRDEWENRGIKSSKDFLMGLGSGFYNDGTYNGFYIQRYGLKQPRKLKDKPSPPENQDMGQNSESSLQESVPKAPHLHEAGHLDKRGDAASEQRSEHSSQDCSGTYQHHVEEYSSLPNVAYMVGLGQSHQSRTSIDPITSSSHQVTQPLNGLNLSITYVCQWSGCQNFRSTWIGDLEDHTMKMHGYIIFKENCICPIEGCDRGVVSQAFTERRHLRTHLRFVHNIRIS